MKASFIRLKLRQGKCNATSCELCNVVSYVIFKLEFTGKHQSKHFSDFVMHEWGQHLVYSRSAPSSPLLCPQHRFAHPLLQQS